MSDRNHWTSLRQRKISRRTMLGASAKAGVGAAGLALVGCGDDDDDAAPAAADTSAIDVRGRRRCRGGSPRAPRRRVPRAAAAAAAEAASAAAAEAESDAAAQAAAAAQPPPPMAAEAAESEDAANAAAAAEAAAAAAAQAADAASAAGDAAAAAVADAAAQAAEAAAQAARDAAAAVEAGTATAEAAQAAIDEAAEAAAAAAAARRRSLGRRWRRRRAQHLETAATSPRPRRPPTPAQEAAESFGHGGGGAAEGPAAWAPPDLNATVRVADFSGRAWRAVMDPIRAGSLPVQIYDVLGQFDQFATEFVFNGVLGRPFEWVDDAHGGDRRDRGGTMKWHGRRVRDRGGRRSSSLDRHAGHCALQRRRHRRFPLHGRSPRSPMRSPWRAPSPCEIPLRTDASAFGVMGTEVRLMPKQLIEEIGDEAFAILGVGSGPFAVESYEPDDLVVTRRFEDYHVEAGSTHRVHKPWMARLEQYVRPEPLSRVAALEADEADMTLSLGWDLSQPFEDSDDFNVLIAAGTDNWNIVFNTERPAEDGTFPFRDIRVRRAVNHAVNWEEIIESRGGFERRNMGIAATSIGALTEQQRADLVMEYDPDKARALLAEAGYENGFHVPFWGYASRFAGIAEGGQAIAQDLGKVGVTTDFQADVHSVFRPRLGARGEDGIHEAAGFHHYFFSTYPDPGGNIGAWIDENGSIAHSKADPDSNIQSLVEATRTAFDPAERAQAINDLQVAIYSEAMFLFGIEQINVGVMRKNLEWINYGVRQDEFNYWGIRPTFT